MQILLVMISSWKAQRKHLPRALTMQANISGQTMDAGNHEQLVRWQTLQHIIHNYVYKFLNLNRINLESTQLWEEQWLIMIKGDKISVHRFITWVYIWTSSLKVRFQLITCLSSLQAGLLMQLCHTISVETSLINTKLGNLVNLGVFFLTFWINSC